MKILVVEDDPSQHELIVRVLCREFDMAESDIDVEETEADAREYIDNVSEEGCPDLCVVDIMLNPWYDGSDEEEDGVAADNAKLIEPEIYLGGFYDAGLRVIQSIRANRRMRNIPVLVYSVVENSKIEPEVAKLVSRFRCIDKIHGSREFVRAARELLHR
ncbi:MAG: hypothetical protein IH621_01920 [Krumholzibacteria bacterium]|nr:hypothetical protein [Candidatus Krumholzibacteria bacterium]